MGVMFPHIVPAGRIRKCDRIVVGFIAVPPPIENHEQEWLMRGFVVHFQIYPLAI
jgi:hypothetical protein